MKIAMNLRFSAFLAVLALVIGSVQPEPLAGTGNNGTSLKGSARLARKRPVVGASVKIHMENDRSMYLLTSTDRKGSLKTMELPDGEYRVTVTKDGLSEMTQSAVAVRFPFRPVVEFVMVPEEAAGAPVAEVVQGNLLEMTGRILNREGEPVPDAVVRLVRLDGAGDPVRLRSGEDGDLEAENLASGVWSVDVRSVGYLRIRSVIELEGEARLLVLLVPQPSGYLAPAIDMLPEEQPVLPAGFTSLP